MAKKKKFDYASLDNDELGIMLSGANSEVILGEPGSIFTPTNQFRVAYKSLVKKGLITEQKGPTGVIRLTGTPGHIPGLRACVEGDIMQWLEEHAAWPMFSTDTV
jgi:hypothetical protein